MANRSGRLYFGVSDTPKGNLVKEVIIRNPGDLTDEDELDLQVGDELIVKFNNGNNEEVYPQLKLMVNDPAQDVGPTGAIPTVTYPGYNEWSAQQLVGFVYCCGKIAGDVITGVDAEFDQAQTVTASFTSEETFLNKIQSTPGTYQFTYHITEETEETEEITGTWYLNEQAVNLTEYGISCENLADEDTIIVNVAYVTEHTEDETYYWKAFQIDKATADTYGVTKLVTDANDLTGEDDERPVGWNVIDDEIDEKLRYLSLTYNGPSLPTNWGRITLNMPGESLSSITIPSIIDSTNDLINNGEDGRGKFWSSTTNNYFYDNSLGIGYLYDAPENPSEGNDGTIHTIIPWYRPDKLPGSTATPQLLTTMGWGSLEAYQNDWKDVDNAAVAPDPQTRIYGNSIRLGMGQVKRTGDSWETLPAGDTTSKKIEFGMTDTITPAFHSLFTIEPNQATFNIPVNINNGINIGGVTLSSYVDSKVTTQINNLKPLFKYGTIESMKLTYPAFNNSDKDHDLGSVPDNLAFKAQAAAAEVSANEYAAVYRDLNSSGNLYMYIKKINGYRPLIIRSWNVNMADNNRAADDFYVWECFLEDIATDHPKVRFGLQNTLKESLQCRFKVGVLYVKDEFYDYVGSLKTHKPSN